MTSTPQRTTAKPWWRFGYMWLVLGGPAVVVLASFITLWLAISIPDPQVTMDTAGKAQALAPAVKARNHAATGVTPSKP